LLPAVLTTDHHAADDTGLAELAVEIKRLRVEMEHIVENNSKLRETLERYSRLYSVFSVQEQDKEQKRIAPCLGDLELRQGRKLGGQPHAMEHADIYLQGERIVAGGTLYMVGRWRDFYEVQQRLTDSRLQLDLAESAVNSLSHHHTQHVNNTADINDHTHVS